MSLAVNRLTTQGIVRSSIKDLLSLVYVLRYGHKTLLALRALFDLVFNAMKLGNFCYGIPSSECECGGSLMYYEGLKFVPLRFKRSVSLQSNHKVKLNLLLCFTRVRFAKHEHYDKVNFILWIDCRITNLLSPRVTNFSPP